MSSRQSETNRWSVFDIPNKFEDLKYQISSASYYVPNVLDLAEINTQLQSCARIREPNQILDYFPLFYSIAIEYGQVPSVSRHQAADALIRLTISEAAEVQRRLHLGLTGDERRLHLNIIKMLCCLLAEFTIRADSDNSQKVEELIPKTQKKGKKGDQSSDNFTNELLRDKCLKALGDVLRAHIRPLWEPSIIDEQFVKTVTKPCYNLLRKQDVHKNAVIKENFPLIIAIMVDKFGHARDASIQFIQAMRLYEHNNSLLLNALQALIKDYQDKGLANELLKEICETNFEASTDSSAFKSMATFITQIAELDPKIIRTHIDLLLDLLTVDVHHIRIAVLIAFAHVIDRELVPVDSLDDSAKKLRDELFRCLSDHVYDSNSYVRTNALQIWAGLIQGKKVPVKQLIQAFEFGLCRLRDAACPVRKEAVTLVMHVILSNPYFGIDVTHADLEEQRIKTEKELEELQKIVNEKDKSDDDDVDENEIDEKSKDTKKLVRRDDDDDDQKKEDAEFIILSSDEENDDNIVNDSRTSNNISQNQSYEMKDVDDIKVKIEKESGENAINQSIHEDLERVQIQQEIDKKKELIAIYKDSSIFLNYIGQANRKIVNLFSSSTIQDCKQAIEFFVSLRHYRQTIPELEQNLRDMFSLIYSNETSIKDAIIQAFIRVYFDIIGTVERVHVPLYQAKNIIRALKGATYAEELCFEEILKQLMKSNSGITDEFLKALWRFYQLQSNDDSDVISGKVLSFISTGNQISNKLNDIIEIAFVTKAKNLNFVHISCVLLQMIGTCRKTENGVRPKPYRLAKTHRLFELLSKIIVENFNVTSNDKWTPMLESAIDVIFKLADNPIKHVENIVKKLAAKAGLKLGKQNQQQSQTTNEVPSHVMDDFNDPILEPDHQSNPSQRTILTDISSLILTRFFNCLGKVAIGILYYIDCTMKEELLRRKDLKESGKTNEKQKQQSIKTKTKRGKNKRTRDMDGDEASMNETLNISMLTSIASKQNIVDEVDTEMDQVFGGAEAEDPVENEITSHIQTICEKNSLLMQYVELILHIISHQNVYNDELLQLSAIICLCKYMLLSVDLCDRQLHTIFHLLKNSSHENVRVTIVVLMNDFYLKYPLALASYSSDVYGCLRDRSVNVRLAALKTISNLILKEMVKPKGQISEIAMCIIDEHSQIASLAISFFMELSKRQHGDALFNILPDILGNLVGGGGENRNLSEEDFERIMEFLFKFIHKERHTESLSEKLCQRFHNADNDPRLWRDLAYIMSKLSYNERALKYLLDHYSWYADKLVDDKVYEYFNVILNCGKKLLTTKPELKVVIDELSLKIEQARTTNGILIAVQQAQKIKQKVNAGRGRGRGGRGGTTPSRAVRSTPQRKQQQRRKQKYSSSSSDEKENNQDTSEVDEKDFIHKTKKRTNPRTKVKKRVDSDDEDDNDF